MKLSAVTKVVCAWPSTLNYWWLPEQELSSVIANTPAGHGDVDHGVRCHYSLRDTSDSSSSSCIPPLHELSLIKSFYVFRYRTMVHRVTSLFFLTVIHICIISCPSKWVIVKHLNSFSHLCPEYQYLKIKINTPFKSMLFRVKLCTISFLKQMDL